MVRGVSRFDDFSFGKSKKINPDISVVMANGDSRNFEGDQMWSLKFLHIKPLLLVVTFGSVPRFRLVKSSSFLYFSCLVIQ